MVRDGVLQPAVVVPAQRGLGEALDELQIGAIAKIRVDKIRQVAVLQLNREPEVEPGAGGLHLLHDSNAVRDITHVIVRHFENEKRSLLLHEPIGHRHRAW